MKITEYIKRPFEFLAELGDSLERIAEHVAILAKHTSPLDEGLGGYVAGKHCRPFAIERSADRLWRREILLGDVLRWRTYWEPSETGEGHRLELTCAIPRVGEQEEALHKLRACKGRHRQDPNVAIFTCSPELIVGMTIQDRGGSKRALYLCSGRLHSHEYRCEGFRRRVLAVYTFSGSDLDWGGVPTTNDPDRPREGMNVGEIPSIETAAAADFSGVN